MLAWMDLEMTGLEPTRDVIVEIATLITDDDLEIIAEGPDLVIHQPAEAGIDTSSLTMVALTQAHGDHINGLLAPDGRRAFRNLSKIVIAEDAVEETQAQEAFRRVHPADGRNVHDPGRGHR